MSTWVKESPLTWFQRCAINVIKCGQIPNHIAFIMDGNRRFATKTQMKHKTDGHVKGFDKLSEALQWCLELGVKEVTVYAFSIENFKRSNDEVDTLMSLAREKFSRLLDERDKLNEQGICIRIIGNLEMLPLDLQRTMAEAMLLTQNNQNAILNVAFAYTSRDEITESIRTIRQGVEDGDLLANEDITDELIRRCMYSKNSPDPDLLVRTSGETRLSDFMLWQISATIIYFASTLWPEFTIWHFLTGIFYYQRHRPQLIDKSTTSAKPSSINSNRMHFENDKYDQEEANQHQQQQKQRITDFLTKIEQRRLEHLNKLAKSNQSNGTNNNKCQSNENDKNHSNGISISHQKMNGGNSWSRTNKTDIIKDLNSSGNGECLNNEINKNT